MIYAFWALIVCLVGLCMLMGMTALRIGDCGGDLIHRRRAVMVVAKDIMSLQHVLICAVFGMSVCSGLLIATVYIITRTP